MAIVIASVCSGCTSTQVTWVGRLEAPAERSYERVPKGGMYVAGWSDENLKKLNPIEGSRRAASAGDRLGFSRTADGQLLALHNSAEVALGPFPPHARTVVWYAERERKTQFGREMGKAATGTREVVTYIVIGTVVVVAVIVVAILWYQDARDNGIDIFP